MRTRFHELTHKAVSLKGCQWACLCGCLRLAALPIVPRPSHKPSHKPSHAFGRFEALPPVIESGLLCSTVDALQIEVHYKFEAYARKDARSRAAVAPWLHDRRAMLLRGLERLQQQHKRGRCRTALSFVDEAGSSW